MADPDYTDDERVIGDFVEDPVVANTESIALATPDLLDSRRARILGERVDMRPKAQPDLRGELPEFAGRGRAKGDPVDHLEA